MCLKYHFQHKTLFTEDRSHGKRNIGLAQVAHAYGTGVAEVWHNGTAQRRSIALVARDALLVDLRHHLRGHKAGRFRQWRRLVGRLWRRLGEAPELPAGPK